MDGIDTTAARDGAATRGGERADQETLVFALGLHAAEVVIATVDHRRWTVRRSTEDGVLDERAYSSLTDALSAARAAADDLVDGFARAVAGMERAPAPRRSRLVVEVGDDECGQAAAIDAVATGAEVACLLRALSAPELARHLPRTSVEVAAAAPARGLVEIALETGAALARLTGEAAAADDLVAVLLRDPALPTAARRGLLDAAVSGQTGAASARLH